MYVVPKIYIQITGYIFGSIRKNWCFLGISFIRTWSKYCISKKFASSIDPHRTRCRKMRVFASFYVMCGCLAIDTDITGYITVSKPEHKEAYRVKFVTSYPKKWREKLTQAHIDEGYKYAGVQTNWEIWRFQSIARTNSIQHNLRMCDIFLCIRMNVWDW